MTKVLQALIAPATVEPTAIQAALGEEIKGVLKFEAPVQRGEFKTFEQIPRDAFKADSFELVTLDPETGVKGIVGELEQKQEGLFGRIFKLEAKPSYIEVDALAETEEVVKAQYSQDLFDELWAMEGAVGSIFTQEKGDPGAKLKAIKTVIGNFLAYAGEALSMTKNEALIRPEKKEKASKSEEKVPGESEVGDPANPDAQKQEPEQKADPVQENPDAQTPEVIPGSVELIQTDIFATEEFKSAMKALFTEALTPLEAKVAGLEGSVQKMEQHVPGSIASKESDDVTVQKADKERPTFQGVFFR